MRLFALALALAAAAPACAQPAPLAEEPLLQVARLPDVWPKSFVVVHDVNFNSILDGRLAVVDTASPNQPLKGLVRDSQMGGALFSRQRGEILTAETFYSRLTRGERTDAVTIWDMKTLQPKGEIVLPGGKRQQSVIYPHLFQFTNHQKWALLANFTPAQSVSVIDIDARKVINEIDLPGCSQIYPTGERGFSSLCADGSIFSVVLDAQGKAASSATIRNVQEIDHQAYFSTPAYIGGTAWFVSQRGLVQGFDLSGPVAKVVPGAFSPRHRAGRRSRMAPERLSGHQCRYCRAALCPDDAAWEGRQPQGRRHGGLGGRSGAQGPCCDHPAQGTDHGHRPDRRGRPISSGRKSTGPSMSTTRKAGLSSAAWAPPSRSIPSLSTPSADMRRGEAPFPIFHAAWRHS
jgi:hypothetical protein